MKLHDEVWRRLPYAVRRNLFRTIERISEFRNRDRSGDLIVDGAIEGNGGGGRYIWVFVATLGEYNLAFGVIERLAEAHPDATLLFITNHALYLETYRRKFPTAVSVVSDGRSSHAGELARRFPPQLLLISEIPCWPGDAPCQLHYALLREVRSTGAPIALINAWIYDYPPSSRSDRLERAFFQRDYLRSMTLITTQTEEVRKRLVAAGADDQRVHVTGNMKFDVVRGTVRTNDRDSSVLLKSIKESPRPSIVAGCVGKVEQTALIAAFRKLRERRQSVRLVVALRHPENHDHLGNLIALLNDAAISWVKRTEHKDQPLPERCDCLILDTFGELASFYSVGIVAYVGRDHNVLEPFAHNVSVSVLSGWKSIFPSYPVYRLLLERGLLHEADDAESLARIWGDHLLARPQAALGTDPPPALHDLAGATDRNLGLLLKELRSVDEGVEKVAPNNVTAQFELHH